MVNSAFNWTQYLGKLVLRPQIAVENLECWWDRILWILSIIWFWYLRLMAPYIPFPTITLLPTTTPFPLLWKAACRCLEVPAPPGGCITIITKDMMTLCWNKFNLIWFTEHRHYTELGTNCSANNCESNYRTFSPESISQSLSPLAHKVNMQWS